MTSITLQALADKFNVTLIGDGNQQITAVASVEEAKATDATFLTDKKYLSQLAECNAGVVILKEANQHDFSGNRLVAQNPYHIYALTAQLLDPTPAIGIHTASEPYYVSNEATVHPTAIISPFATIEAGVEIAEHCHIGSGAYIGHNCQIGAGCKIYPNANLYFGSQLGKNCIIHSSAVIGSDGFGFANDKGKWVKIPQVGHVILGDNVEVGSNTSIDRGTIKNTIIHNGVKIDNLVHIAHNVEIDEDTALAAGVIMAGSTYIGKRCTMAGGVALNGHIRITDDVHITGFSMVTKSINEPGVYSSGIPATDNRTWRKNTVKLRQVDSLFDRVKALEKQIESLLASNQ